MNLYTIKKFIKDILTENDGLSFCPVRVFAAALSAPTIMFFTADCAVQLYHGHLDLQTLATAFATMTGGFAALGAGVAVKACTDNRGQ